MTVGKKQSVWISIFVAVWLAVFMYESTRFFFLNPLFKTELPKWKFLFPPAGWIMFFNVNDQAGFAEVYGVKNNTINLIDPHKILMNRTIGFDNVHRNILSTVLNRHYQSSFCAYLDRKFPYYDRFLVTHVHYPALSKQPEQRDVQVVYTCE